MEVLTVDSWVTCTHVLYFSISVDRITVPITLTWYYCMSSFSKPLRYGQEDSHMVESGTQEGKLSMKSSLAQRGFQNRAHGLRVFMNLRFWGTSRPGHRHTQNGVVKEEFCPIQLEPQSLDLKQKHSSRPLTLNGLLFKATWRLKSCVETTCELTALSGKKSLSFESLTTSVNV